MEKAELRKKDAESALKAVFEGISTALEKGEPVTIKDFGTFQVTERAAREGRNQQTGVKINIAASKRVKVKPGKNLKDRVR
jgi:DNA-binding protein HU-beta